MAENLVSSVLPADAIKRAMHDPATLSAHAMPWSIQYRPHGPGRWLAEGTYSNSDRSYANDGPARGPPRTNRRPFTLAAAEAARIQGRAGPREMVSLLRSDFPLLREAVLIEGLAADIETVRQLVELSQHLLREIQIGLADAPDGS